MPAALRARLTYANVMATLALFVALGGSSYAAIQLTGRDIKNASLTGKDVRNGTLAGVDVKDGSLRTGDFGAGQVPQGPRGDQGPKGDPGAQGAQGARGLQGADGQPNPNAANSELLDNLDSTAFLRSFGTAVNSDRLDNLDSAVFARGANAHVRSGAVAMAEGESANVLIVSGEWLVSYICPSDPSTNGTIVFQNASDDTLNVFADNGSGNPTHTELSTVAESFHGANASGEAIVFDVQGLPNGHVAQVRVLTVNRPSQDNCHAQAVAVDASPSP